MADDKTAALVVALSAQLTKFERDMKQAGDIADREVGRIEDRFSKLNPGVSASFFGNLLANFASKGLDAAVKAVTDLVERFVELRKVAELTQVSMNELFGVQQAANEFKVPIDEANASIRTLASLLNQMQRGEKNSLSQLLDFNPEALRGLNRDTLTLQQTLQVVERIIQNAFNNLDKVDLGKFAGLSEKMSLALGNADKSFTGTAQSAARTAPDLEKIAASAKQFDDFVASAASSIKAFAAQDTIAFFENTKRELEGITDLSIKFLGLFKEGPLDAFAASAIAKLTEFRQSLAATVAAASSGGGARVVINTGAFDRSGSSRVPVKPEPREPQDSFDRTEESITRHTATINADTIAVSQNNAVQAQLRAEFQLLNAIRKDDGEVTQDQIDAYTKLRETMTAQEALVAAGIELNGRHAQSFIRVSEGAGIATGKFDDAKKKVSDLNNVSQQAGQALSTAFADAILEGKSLQDVLNSLLKTLARFGINSVFGSFFNAPASGGLSPFASLLGGIGHNAEGTDNWRGGPTWVGERGPEIVNLPKGSQVIPNGRAAGGTTFAPVYQIDAAGADTGTVIRIQQVLEKHARAIASQGKAMASAQRFQASGVS